MESEVSILPFELSLAELAVLALTNDGVVERPEYRAFERKEPIVLSCKGSYVWGSMIAEVLRWKPHVSEAAFIDAYRRALGKNRGDILRHYSGAQSDMLRYYSEAAEAGIRRIAFERRFPYSLFADFLGFFHADSSFVFAAEENAKEAYLSLAKRRLVEDPIFTTLFGVSVAVLGMVPYSFTQRTRHGRTVYRKIEALFWSYETREDEGEKITNVHFRLWKILRAFKKALAEAMEDIVEGPESEG